MSANSDSFDDSIEKLTNVILDFQRFSRRLSVQKVQCSTAVILCHDVINKLREAEEDPDVELAMDRCHDLIEDFRSQSSGWSKKLKSDLHEFSLLLVPTVNRDVAAFVERILGYSKEFPSIFAAVQEKKWHADLARSRTRDNSTNKSHLQALIDGQNEMLISLMSDTQFKGELWSIAQELDLADELSFIDPGPHSNNAPEAAIAPESAPASFEHPVSAVVQQNQLISQDEDLSNKASSKQNNLDAIWNTISTLEQHMENNPAFEAQLQQLRMMAKMVMISTDEVMSRPTRSSLLEHIVATKPSASNSLLSPIFLTGSKNEHRITHFVQQPSAIPTEPSSLMPCLQQTHILEYLNHHPSSDRFRLCIDISQGLAHMHTHEVVLGDFTPWNITIDQSGRVQLRELDLSQSSGRPIRGTWRSQLPDARYIPPEVITLPPEEEYAQDLDPKKSDVYAFTMLAYEILSFITPWDKLDIPSIVSQVTRGNRPSRPSSPAWFQNIDLWALLQSGWHQLPEKRPDMTTYAGNLEYFRKLLPDKESNQDLYIRQEAVPKPLLYRATENLSIMEDLSFDITREVKMVGSLLAPYAHGGFCDIFIGRRGMEKVAMKRLRMATIGDEDIIKKRFIRECEVWKKLKHPNVLDFYGIVKHGGSLFMISPFLDDGDASTWLQTHCCHRLRVLVEAARGCLYLHSLLPKPTIHGDIKGGNILIKSNGQAVLSDFGLSKTMNAHTSHGLKDTGTGPYMAPELFAHCNDPDIECSPVPITKTLETDVFAFGRTAIELLSGQLPYGDAAMRPIIWIILLKGKRPARPMTPAANQWISDTMWTFINEMTHVKSECRPSMHDVVVRLESFRLELDPNCDTTPDGSELGLENEEVEGRQDSDMEDVIGESEDEDGYDLPLLATPISKDQRRHILTKSKGILKGRLPSAEQDSHKPPKNVQFIVPSIVELGYVR